MPDPWVEVVRVPDADALVRLGGTWRTRRGIPTVESAERTIVTPPRARRVAFDTGAIEGWDSALVVFVARVRRLGERLGCAVDLGGLPDGARRLLALADAEALRAPAVGVTRPSWLTHVGEVAAGAVHWVRLYLAFIGEVSLAVGRFVTLRARYRAIDVWTEVQAAGAGALVIVAVVGFLLGTILAFVAAVALRPFGARLYIANAVAVGVIRELGPIMTAIVMAGRTGSAYAAQLGTMRVTEEIEALEAMGLLPFDFLVMPRLLALSFMMPLLTVYADAMGMLGGALVAAQLPDVGITRFLLQAREALPLNTVWIGLGKSVVFGALVAICGCLEGIRAGKSSAAVGHAATAAVVQSIIWIIGVDGLFAIALDIVGL